MTDETPQSDAPYPNGENGPLSNGENGNGRDGQGRFVKGNPGGPGSPTAQYAVKFRLLLDGVLDEVVTRDRLKAAVESCLTAAEAGLLPALKELLDRMTGPPRDRDLACSTESLKERMSNLEACADYKAWVAKGRPRAPLRR